MTHAQGTQARERAAAPAFASPCGVDPMMAARQRYVTSTLVGRRFLGLWVAEDSKDRSVPPLTPVKIVSLAYIAHGMYMAFNNGKTLVSEKVRAWTYGPIFPELFNAIRIYGNDAVLDVPQGQREQISRDVRLLPEEIKFIDGAYQAHRRTVDTDLLAINHAVGTPWHDTWDGSKYRDIDNGLICCYFQCLVGKVHVEKRGTKL